MSNSQPKARPQTLASMVLEADSKALLAAHLDKGAIPHLIETAKAGFFIHRQAEGERKSKQFASTVRGTRTDFYDRKIIPPGNEPSPRAIKRAKRQIDINGISIKTQEALAEAGITKLDQVLIKGTERVDIELLATIRGIGKTRIEEIKAFAAKCFEI